MKPEPLDTARVFERVFSIYRAQAAVLLPAALLVYLLPAALGVLETTAGRALSLAAVVIAGIWYQGMVVEAVRDIQDGRRDLSIGGLFRSVADVLGPLIWTALLVGLGVFLGMLAFIIPGLVLLTWWSVAAPAVVIERLGPLAAIGRSRELVRGHGWRVFSVLVVTISIILIVSVAIQSLVLAIGDSGIAAALGVLLANTLTAPLFALAASVLYLALRAHRGEPLRPEPGPASAP